MICTVFNVLLLLLPLLLLGVVLAIDGRAEGQVSIQAAGAAAPSIDGAAMRCAPSLANTSYSSSALLRRKTPGGRASGVRMCVRGRRHARTLLGAPRIPIHFLKNNDTIQTDVSCTYLYEALDDWDA
eukprot:COSAG03_NODE_1464_length_4033_cov_2.296645_5_plen_127_part_00